MRLAVWSRKAQDGTGCHSKPSCPAHTTLEISGVWIGGDERTRDEAFTVLGHVLGVSERHVIRLIAKLKRDGDLHRELEDVLLVDHRQNNTDNMPQDIREFTDLIATKLPKSEGDEKLIFREDMFASMPERFQTSDLVVKKRDHDYNGSFIVDQPHFYGHKPIYEALAVVIIGVLLNSSREQVEIRLDHPQSDISFLRVQYWHTDLNNKYIHGLHLKPFVFAYVPEENVSLKPWLNQIISDVEEYPRFGLTTRDGFPETPDQWAARDTINGFGSAKGAARFAQLLLDISRPGSTTSEIMLEGEGGFRGVAPLSAEARLCLPGGVSFEQFW